MTFELEQFSKLALPHSSERVDHAQKVLDYTFKYPGLLEAALTHPSAHTASAHSYDYERLEFLGDAVLGALVSYKLFISFPDLDEGGLTRIKVSLVSGSTLSQVAHSFGFEDFIIFGESEMGADARGLVSALENVYESVLAALFLDGGIPAAKKWLAKSLYPLINKDVATQPENPKSSLQEYLQARHKSPHYKITKVRGPAHARVFSAQVTDGKKILGSGSGRSKKDAETLAAKQALHTLGLF